MTQNKRDISRERNRMALIEAALDCVAELGMANTSVSEIIGRSGLSRGMIHLHFNGKAKLMEAAIAHSSDLYYEALDRLLEQAGSDASPQARIEAIVRSDLSAEVLNTRSVRIWYAFRGEAHNHEIIRLYSDTRHDRLRKLIYQPFLAIFREVGADDPAGVARDVTHGTLALMEGMWTDFLLHPDSFDRDAACRIVFRFLAALCPQHFDLPGAREDG
ncbi:MAG TPA: TetR family transcriptional regulator C-terminal domain-containing protein [Roseovarius sp.]